MSLRKIETLRTVAGVLGVVLFSASAGNSAQLKVFPKRHQMIDVTATTYGAIPNDNVSDQAAIRKALGSGGNWPNPKVIYLPAGTYLFDNTIQMWGDTGINGCCATFQGQGAGQTVIKLMNSAAGFGSASSPKPFIATSLTSNNNSAFRFNIYDLTVEVGTGNAGAMAVDYICSNQGAIENVEIKADGDAFSGLEMTRSWPGPCLIQNVSISGFNYGIRVGQSQYSITFESITLSGQKTYGILNQGNLLFMRNLISTNSVPVLNSSQGIVVLVDGTLTGQSASGAAISLTGGAYFYGRTISAPGYSSVISGAPNPIVEYASNTQLYTQFNDSWGMLKLPIKKAPEFFEYDTSKWVCILDHTEPAGPRATPYPSLKAAVNFAAANGKTTVYAPQAGASPYLIITSPVVIPASVKQIVGFDSKISSMGTSRALISVEGNTTDPLIIDRVGFGQTSLIHKSNRPLVIKHCDLDTIFNAPGAGDLFIEDDRGTHLVLRNPQNVWLRQYNPETQSAVPMTMADLSGGVRVWILGLKTEGVGNFFTISGGSSLEVLGGFLYPVDADTKNLSPFISTNSCMSLIYYAVGGYTNQVTETRGTSTKTLTSAQVGGMMTMYVANPSGCVSSNVQPDPVPRVVAPKMVPKTHKFPSLSAASSIVLPANARGCALFNVRGAKVWQYTRTTSGDVTVQVPRNVAAAGIAVVSYQK